MRLIDADKVVEELENERKRVKEHGEPGMYLRGVLCGLYIAIGIVKGADMREGGAE